MTENGLRIKAVFVMAKSPSIEDLFKKASSANATPTDSSAAASSSPTASSKAAKAPIAPPTTTQKLSEKMGDIKLQEKEKIAQEEAAKLGLPYLALRGFPIAPEVLSLIPKETSAALHLIPFIKVD